MQRRGERYESGGPGKRYEDGELAWAGALIVLGTTALAIWALFKIYGRIKGILQ